MRASLMAVASLAAFGLALSGCATADVTGVIKAANDLDPACYKNVHIAVTPMMLFGWAVPVVSGTYDKVCNSDQAQAPAARPILVPGQVLGASAPVTPDAR